MTSTRDLLADRWNARTRRSIGWRLLVVLGVLGDLTALAGLIAHFHAPGSVYSAALAAFAPYLGLGAVAATVAFGLARALTGWLGVVVSLVLVAAVAALQAPLFTADDVPGGRDVTVMTANLWLGRAQPEAVVAAARRHHVQVLMLEELTPQVLDGLHRAGLDTLMRYRIVAPAKTGVGTGMWSTAPLADTAVGHDLGFNYVTARLDLGPGRPVSLLALHLYGPYPATQTPGWLHDLRTLPSILRRLPAGPTLVGGDFNATTDVAQFRDLLTGGFADAADQAGAGFTPTYPANRAIPLIAIDHVLTRDAVAHAVDTVLIPDSDHRALVVTARIPD